MAGTKVTDEELRDYCENIMSNETSVTTASSEGESNVREYINASQDRRRGANQEEQEQEDYVEMELEAYNPLVHKTSFQVQMNEQNLFDFL